MGNLNILSIKFRIWKNKNSNGVFYYRNDKSNEFKNLYFNYGPNTRDCLLTKRYNNDIKFLEYFRYFNPEKDDNILFRIRRSYKTNNYEIINPIKRHKISTNKYGNDYLNDKIWYPVKSSVYSEGNNENYILNENDIIKFGRIKYSIVKKHFSFEKEKENTKDNNFDKNNNISYISNLNKNSKSIFDIDINTNQYKIINNKDSINNSVKIIKSKNSDENKSGDDMENENEYNKCWICLISDSDIKNPLICLCNCHNYVHYECLKMYLSLKTKVSENLKRTVTTYICSKFNCDICLKPYHLQFRIPEFDKIYELMDLTLPEETDYICLESLDFIKDNNNIKTFHIVQLNDQEITIGSKYDNDIIDKDIFISKEHAVLRYNKDNRNIILENKSEKYGTLVLVRGDIKITKKKTYFQIGNIYISMELKDIISIKNHDKKIPNLIFDRVIEHNYNEDDNNVK